ncbi:MAG: SUMF1/EgtB/PvdO family nonheme iron enzyme [Chitinophagales bacterium]
MKKTSLKVTALALLALASSCGKSGSNGQLVGDQTRMNYRAPLPIGTVYIPSGTYKMGASDEDIRGRNDATIHTVQVVGFYMDATEVSNQEYRQFTNWVRDSIANTILGNFKDNPDGTQRLDMSKRINWKDPELQDQLSAMYVPAELSGWGRKEIDASKLIYTYTAFNYADAARNPNDAPIKYVNKFPVPAYPDTTVWMRQYSYSYNEPIAQQYFWFQGFNKYPVVGVNWKQCNAFCDWRTHLWRSEREREHLYTESRFRLPTEQEWEWAARGGRNESPYPWGGPYIINKKGCYLANFKPQRGNYSADGGLYTVPVDWYAANDYGLKNMAGNVSEWTSSAFFGGSYNQMADINPSVGYNVQPNDPLNMRRKVVRGGSWRDVAYYLQVSTRDYEYEDTAKAYIGFRCVYVEVVPALSNRRPVRQ